MDTNNHVIRARSRESRDVVRKRCRRDELEGRTTIDRVGEETDVVHLPETSVISTVATYTDGSSIEMANIGREACSGTSSQPCAMPAN
jgi:hypothetical protein